MPMNIVIIGSRNYADKQRIISFIDTLPDNTLVISGGARGVDTIAIVAAQLRGLEVLVFPANWGKRGKSAGMIRNGEIIDSKPDMVVAFRIHHSKKSSGTDNMIARAKAKKIPVMINPSEYVAPNKQMGMF